jgi:hypothetical protein
MKIKSPHAARCRRPFPGFATFAILSQFILAGCDPDTKKADTTPVPTTAATAAVAGPSAKSLAVANPNANATASLPFKLEVVEVTNSTLPAVQSFASATADGKWLIIGGRIAGLHGFNPDNNNFPRSSANTVAYVIDPGANKVLGSVDLVKSLPAQLAGPLTATSAESAQLGNNLFIVGGYGTDLQSGNITTFGSIIKIDVPGLINAIVSNAPIAGFFTQNPTPDNRLKVTGGDLKAFQDMFFLAYGQDFTGFYSVENRDYNRAGGQFQKYNETIRVFTLNPDMSIATFQNDDGPYDDSLPYHRRDLNVVDIIQADGVTPAAVVYGGVFRAGQVAGLTAPIDIPFPAPSSSASPSGTPSVPIFPAPVVQKSFQQALNHYDCANLTIFDQASSSSFTNLLGGISQYHYNWLTNSLTQDQVDLSIGVDGLPFINTISTIQHQPTAGQFAQFIQPAALPGLVGTGARFLFNPAVKAAGAMFENGVFKLASLNGRTLVGHMVGGIESYGPYSGLACQNPSTIASPRFFEIWVTPGASPVIPMPAIPTSTTPHPAGTPCPSPAGTPQTQASP